MNLFPWFLLLHVLGAIVAFGPTFAFPLIGSMGGKEPMHANFATRVTEKISHGITFPLAIVQGLTGVGLIITGAVDLTRALWLDVAIVLYLVALAFSYFVLTPRVARIVEMTSKPPTGMPGPPAADAPLATTPGATMAGGVAMDAGAAAGPPQAGPPPALLALVKQVQQGGMVLTGLIVAIVVLMVIRPTL